jgi:D-amino-acid dehydrogenase
MQVIVVGGGIIGVCAAYYLRNHGMEVTVIERRGDVALEASFGNAGLIAPGYVAPWAAPGMPRKVLSYLMKDEAPVRFRPQLSPRFWRWVSMWLGECTAERFRVNKSRMQRVAFYSRDELHKLRDKYGLRYEQSRGYLQLFRSAHDLRMSEPARALLTESGVEFKALSPDDCRALEPALSQSTRLAGGLHLPGDESGNCPLFARQLKEEALRNGVRFRFNESVSRLISEGGRVTGVLTDRGPVKADAVVLAAAVDSARLMKPLGLRLPIYPVKGYSATVNLTADAAGPQQAIMDEAYKTAITPMGARLRIAGTAEIGNRELTLEPRALQTLVKVASDWFPMAARYSEAHFWVGARPMLPDGPPVLGATRVPGLFLDVGHGSTGWAMACGSGRIVADVVAGLEPGISLDGLTLERYNPH